MEALDLDGVHLVGNSLGGWIAAEIAVRNTQRLRTLTLVGAAGIHVNGVPKGDMFLWTPEERVRNLFVDQRFAEQRLAHADDRGAERHRASRTSSRPPTSPGTRASTIRRCANGCIASTCRR